MQLLLLLFLLHSYTIFLLYRILAIFAPFFEVLLLYLERETLARLLLFSFLFLFSLTLHLTLSPDGDGYGLRLRQPATDPLAGLGLSHTRSTHPQPTGPSQDPGILCQERRQAFGETCIAAQETVPLHVASHPYFTHYSAARPADPRLHKGDAGRFVSHRSALSCRFQVHSCLLPPSLLALPQSPRHHPVSSIRSDRRGEATTGGRNSDWRARHACACAIDKQRRHESH